MGRLGASRRSRATAGNRAPRDANAGADPRRAERRGAARDDRALRGRTSLLGGGCRAHRRGRLRRALPPAAGRRRTDRDAASRLSVHRAHLLRARAAGHGAPSPGARVAGAGDRARVRPGGRVMTRAAWIDPGNDPRGDLTTRFGITDPYFDGRWLLTKPNPSEYLRGVRAKGFAPGVYLCSQGDGWPSASSTKPETWATWAYNMIQKQIAPGTSGSFPKVHLNCETHDPAWLLAMLKQWRAHSPKRETALVIEGMQGGWFKAVARQISSDLGVTVIAEAFHGNMVRSESADVLIDLVNAQTTLSHAGVCLDAAQLGDWWGVNVPAVAFTQG